MAAFNFVPLPVRITEQSDESGLGFLLRCAQSNGLRLQALADYAGVQSLQWVSASDIEVLAFLAQVSPTWLAERLRQRHWIDRRPQISYGSWEWGWVGSLRVQRPQVCCACLADAPYCRSDWELTSVVACVKHRLPLLDHCRHCQRPLSWHRPAVDVCQCGRYLSPDSSLGKPSETLLFWCESIAGRFHGRNGDSGAFSDVTPLEWPVHTSPDGAYRLVHALGILELANQRIPLGKVTETQSPNQLATVLERGLMRAQLLREDSNGITSELRETIYIPSIERLASFGVCVADRQIANGYLRRLGRDASTTSALRRHWRGGRKPKGQLELFEHDDI